MTLDELGENEDDLCKIDEKCWFCPDCIRKPLDSTQMKPYKMPLAYFEIKNDIKRANSVDRLVLRRWL